MAVAVTGQGNMTMGSSSSSGIPGNQYSVAGVLGAYVLQAAASSTIARSSCREN